MANSGTGPPQATASGKPKVLIVDDEPDVLESTALLVEGLGYDVIRLSDPSAILEMVEKEKPGLLLQDLRMPDLNVAGLVASLRSNPATAEVPLVFFSAGGDLPTSAARYDAWGYLPKPFGLEELASLLERVLGPPARAPRRHKPHNPQREIRSIFHDYWNLIAALSNYIEILEKARVLAPEERRSVQGLTDIILKLESKTDRLRAYIMSLVTAMEPAPPEPDHELR